MLRNSPFRRLVDQKSDFCRYTIRIEPMPNVPLFLATLAGQGALAACDLYGFMDECVHHGDHPTKIFVGSPTNLFVETTYKDSCRV